MNSILSRPTQKLDAPANPVLSTSAGRGFQAAPLRYSPAPQIDARGFIAQAQGMAAIGDSMQSVGNNLAHVSAAMSHAVNVRRITEAKLGMSQASQDIAAEIALESDPNKWEGIAAKRSNETVKNLINPSDSPAARQAIELHAAEWGIHLQGQTKLSAISRQFDLTGQTLKVAHEQAIAAKDYEGASRIEAELTPYLGPAALENTRLQSVAAQRTDVDTQAKTMIENEGAAAVPKVKELYESSPHFDKQTRDSRMAGMEYQAKVEDMGVLAVSNPFAAMELAKAHGLRGPDLVRIEKLVESTIQDERGKALKGYEEGIKMGNLPSPSELQSNRFLTDFDRGNVAAFATQGAKNDPVAFATLFADAANFKGDEGSPEYAVISQRVSMALDGDLQAKAFAKLGESVANKKPDELTRSMNEVFSLAKDDLTAGRFGPLHGTLADTSTRLSPKMRAEVDAIRAELLTDEEKARIAATPSRSDYIEAKARETWYQRNHAKPADGESFVNHVVDDADKAATAQRRYGDAIASLEAWKKANPNATPQELRAQYDKSLVVQRAAGGLPSLFPDSAPRIDLKALEKTRAILNSK